MNGIVELNRNNFRSTIEGSESPVLVDFWAPWCGPCRMIAPELDALKKELGDGIVIGKVNVDDESILAEQFGVQSIPNLMVFKNGKPVQQVIGFRTKSELLKVLSGA